MYAFIFALRQVGPVWVNIRFLFSFVLASSSNVSKYSKICVFFVAGFVLRDFILLSM
jgi:hypothetical protein